MARHHSRRDWLVWAPLWALAFAGVAHLLPTSLLLPVERVSYDPDRDVMIVVRKPRFTVVDALVREELQRVAVEPLLFAPRTCTPPPVVYSYHRDVAAVAFSVRSWAEPCMVEPYRFTASWSAYLGPIALAPTRCDLIVPRPGEPATTEC